MPDKIPMTPEGYRALEEEIKRLKRIERPKIAKDLAEAMGHGDLAENSEYEDAKQRREILEKKIMDLEDKFARAVIVEPHGNTEDVSFGVTVRVKDETTGRETTYTIVGEGEGDISQGRIAITSPIARALVGHRVGERVEVTVPAGVKVLEILGISS